MVSGGSQDSKSKSRPLTGPERADIFNWGIRSLGSALPSSMVRYPEPVAGGQAAGSMSQADMQREGEYRPVYNDAGDIEYYHLNGRAISPAEFASRSIPGGVRVPQQGFIRDMVGRGSQPEGSGMQLVFPEYNSPEFRGLSGGDYDRLEESVIDTRWAPIRRLEELERDAPTSQHQTVASGLQDSPKSRSRM